MKRQLYIEVLRGFACIMVVCVHTLPAATMDFPGGVISVFSKLGVPLFVMITGALVLNNNYEVTATKAFRKALHYFRIWLVWAVIYAILRIILQGNCIWGCLDIKRIIIHTMDTQYHLWYLLLLVSIWLIMPLLKYIALNQYIRRYVVVLGVIYTFCVGYFLQLMALRYPAVAILENNYKRIGYAFYTGYIILVFVGYELSQIVVKKRILCIIGILGFAGMYISAYLLPHQSNSLVMLDGNLSIFTLLLAASCLLWVKQEYTKIPAWISKTLSCVGGYSLGIYLFHPMVIMLFPNKLSAIPFLEFLIRTAVAFFGSVMLTIISRKIQFVSKIGRKVH